jgi:hypothetical protein
MNSLVEVWPLFFIDFVCWQHALTRLLSLFFHQSKSTTRQADEGKALSSVAEVPCPFYIPTICHST